jgi:hypothetical protein
MSAPAHRQPPSRRAVLTGLAGLLAAGGLSACGLDVRDIRLDNDQPVPTRTPGADELARRRAVIAADGLRRLAAAGAAAHPDLTRLLTAVADAHAVQLDALGAADLAVETPDATTSSPSTSGPARPAGSGTPPVTELVAQETAAAEQAVADLAATGGGSARLLASIAAADAVHARQLAGALKQPAPPLPSPLSATTPPATPSDAESLDVAASQALAAAVDGELAAVYGYGIVAARLTDGQRDTAMGALAEHQQAAHALTAWLTAAGQPAPVAAPAYEVPVPVRDARDAVALAVLLEERTAGLAGDVVATGGPDLRLVGTDLLVGRALRAAAWRGAGVPLPGLTTDR